MAINCYLLQTLVSQKQFKHTGPQNVDPPLQCNQKRQLSVQNVPAKYKLIILEKN